MRKIIVLSMITLDGVIQAPGAPGEDISGDFKYGGWVASYFDEDYGKVLEEQLQPADLLLGRTTFDIFADYWPTHEHEWPGINTVTKYVISNTVKSSHWQNSIFLESVGEIEEIKRLDGPDIQVHGSGELVQLLLKHDLVDELWLKIHPLVLGKGKKLFDKGAISTAWSLIKNSTTSSGVIIASYKRAGDVKTGTVGA